MDDLIDEWMYGYIDGYEDSRVEGLMNGWRIEDE
jgi:hypothetical protein